MTMLSRFSTLGGAPTDPYWTSVSYLLVGNGANGTTTNIVDSSSNNVSNTITGSVVISTAQSKFGTGSSVYFPGSSSCLALTSAGALCAFGSGAFTIEGWLYLPNTSIMQFIYDSRPTGTQGLYPTIYILGGVMYLFANSLNLITSSSIPANQWFYFAVSKSSGSTRLYIAGTQSGSTYTDSNTYLNGSDKPFIGSSAYYIAGVDSPLNGYLYDLRITKGVGRYTGSTMSVPTAPLPIG
jgi:hypothetical protein